LRTESATFTDLNAMLEIDIENASEDELRDLITDLQSHRVDSITVAKTERKKGATKKQLSGAMIIKEMAKQSGKSEEEVMELMKAKGLL
jgi:hypothetical protein